MTELTSWDCSCSCLSTVNKKWVTRHDSGLWKLILSVTASLALGSLLVLLYNACQVSLLGMLEMQTNMQSHRCPATGTGDHNFPLTLEGHYSTSRNQVTQCPLHLPWLCLLQEVNVYTLSVAVSLNSCCKRFSRKVGVHGSFRRRTVSKPSCEWIVGFMHCFMKVELGFRPIGNPSSTVPKVSHLAYLSVDSVVQRNVRLPSSHGSTRLSNYVHFMALVIRCTRSAVVSFGYTSWKL